MSLKQAAVALAAVAFCTLQVSSPASEQYESCAGIYSRVMALYQTAPYSPDYNQLSASYSSRCLGGMVAAPV